MQSPSSHTIKSAGNQTHVAMTHADHTLQRLIQLSSKFHVTTYRCHEGRGSKGEGSCAQEETGDGPDFVHRVRLDVKIHFPARQAKATGGACSGSHLRPFTCMKRSSRPPPAAGHVHKQALPPFLLGGADHAQHDGTSFLRFRQTQQHQLNPHYHPLAAHRSLRSISPAENSAQQILDLPSWNSVFHSSSFSQPLARLESDAQRGKLVSGTVVILL